jgi:hypothetical protein
VSEPITAEAIAAALLAARSAPPRFALTKAEAAASIGVSVDFFEAHVQPHLDLIRKGRKVLVPTTEIERWVAERAAPTLPELRR